MRVRAGPARPGAARGAPRGSAGFGGLPPADLRRSLLVGSSLCVSVSARFPPFCEDIGRAGLGPPPLDGCTVT